MFYQEAHLLDELISKCDIQVHSIASTNGFTDKSNVTDKQQMTTMMRVVVSIVQAKLESETEFGILESNQLGAMQDRFHTSAKPFSAIRSDRTPQTVAELELVFN